MPLNPVSTFASASAGSSSRLCSQGAAKSSSVKGSIEGWRAAGTSLTSGSDAVEPGLDLRVGERRQQQPALLPGRGEVLLGEGQHRGLAGRGDLVDLGIGCR